MGPGHYGEVRPKRVAEWLGSIPDGDALAAARQIHQALFAQNRVMLEPGNRQEVMALLCPRVSRIADTMLGEFEAAALPHDSKTVEDISFVQRFLGEMVTGYNILANEAAAGGGETSRGLAPVVHRAMYFLTQVHVASYMAYAPVPAGLWRDMHHLYRFAVAKGAASTALPLDWLDGSATAISTESLYARALLLALASPYGMLQGECRRTLLLLEAMPAEGELLTHDGSEDPRCRFLVSLVADSPPVPLGRVARIDASADVRVFGTAVVVEALRSALGRLADGSSDGPNAHEAQLLRWLVRMWSGSVVRRRWKRKRSGMILRLCTGINAIHFFASSRVRIVADPEGGGRAVSHATPVVATGRRDGARAGASGPGGAREEGAPEVVDGANAVRHEEADRSVQADSGFRGPGLLRDEGNVFHVESCRAVNQSAGGFCLRLQRGSDFRVRVGDLLGLELPGLRNWRVGILRWMRGRDADTLDVGVELLGPELRSVAVRREPGASGGESAFLQALLIPGNAALRQPESIILPGGTYQPGRRLHVEDGTSVRTVTPLGVADRTSGFDQLLISKAT